MTKLLTFHSSMLSPERSDMSDRLISDQAAYIAHLFYTAHDLKKKKVAWYSPVITVSGSSYEDLVTASLEYWLWIYFHHGLVFYILQM